jgi:hypothetical protein
MHHAVGPQEANAEHQCQSQSRQFHVPAHRQQTADRTSPRSTWLDRHSAESRSARVMVLLLVRRRNEPRPRRMPWGKARAPGASSVCGTRIVPVQAIPAGMAGALHGQRVPENGSGRWRRGHANWTARRRVLDDEWVTDFGWWAVSPPLAVSSSPPTDPRREVAFSVGRTGCDAPCGGVVRSFR